MDKFDQWYNKKMDEQEVAYSESSWDSFSQQLDQLPGSQKRRRPFMYLWVLGLSLSLGAGSIFAWHAYENTGSSQEILHSTDENKDSKTNPVSKSNSDKTNYGNTGEPLAAIVLPEPSSVNSEINAVKADQDPAIVSSSASSQSSSQHKKIKSVSAKGVDIQQRDTYLESKSNIEGSFVTSGHEKKEASSRDLIFKDLPSSKDLQAEKMIKSNIVSSDGSDATGTEVYDVSSKSSIDKAHASATLAVYQVVDPLPTEIKNLEYSFLVLPVLERESSYAGEISSSHINCCSFKRWTHHTELGAQFYPGVNQGSRFFTGLQAAYHLQFQWAQRWSVSAGAGVLQRWGSFGGFQDSPQDIYTTTRVRRGFLLVPTAATYIQVPTMVNFHAGRHNIGAGVRTLFLIGVKGQLEEYQLQRNAVQADFSFNSNTVNKGWINESGFRSLVPEFILSYGYQISPHWSVSVNGGWMPNGIVFGDKSNENFDLIESLTASIANDAQQPYLLEDKWQIGIALRYKF